MPMNANLRRSIRPVVWGLILGLLLVVTLAGILVFAVGPKLAEQYTIQSLA
jgi:hypothetical protein